MPRLKTDEERGYIGAWMRRERESRNWTQDEMPQRLAPLGYSVRADYYRQVEAGKKPGPDFLATLVRLFGSEPQPFPAKSEAPTSSSDIGALVAAIREQNEINRALVAAVSALVAQTARPDVPAPEWFLREGQAMTDGVQAGVAEIRADIESALAAVVSLLPAPSGAPRPGPK